MRASGIAFGGLLAALFTLSAAAADVTVFAAASLRESMDAQARAFEAATGNKIVVSYGGSNTLARQIEAAAPADLFISADLEWMDYLDTRKRIAPGTRVELVRNTLVLIAPAGSASALQIAPGFALATALDGGKLAMANPDSVPAGKYGKAALEKLGVWTSVEKQVARAENVRAALALVARGEAPYGIVYRTDALAEKAVKVVGAFPPDSYLPIVYPAAVIAESKSPAARALLAHLRSAAARSTWARFGFVPAGE